MKNIPHTPSSVGVLQRIIFSHTPDEAMSGGLAKACVPGKNCSVSEKIEFLIKSSLRVWLWTSIIFSSEDNWWYSKVTKHLLQYSHWWDNNYPSQEADGCSCEILFRYWWKVSWDFWKQWYLGMLLLRQLQMNFGGLFRNQDCHIKDLLSISSDWPNVSKAIKTNINIKLQGILRGN